MKKNTSRQDPFETFEKFVLVISVIALLILVGIYFVAPVIFEEASVQEFVQGLTVNLISTALLFLLAYVVFYKRMQKIRSEQESESFARRVADEVAHRLESPSAIAFFDREPTAEDLQNLMRSADKIRLCGVTLTFTLNRSLSYLLQKVLEGTDVGIMIIYPSEETLISAAKRSETGNIDYYRKRLEASLNDIEYLYKNWNESIDTNKLTKGKLEIRLLPYTPSFGIRSFESKNEHVQIIEIYPHHKGYDSTPHFYLTPEKDGTWYEYFVIQFEEMWKRTIPWQTGMTITAEVPKSMNSKKWESEWNS